VVSKGWDWDSEDVGDAWKGVGFKEREQVGQGGFG
jgi:hypothetical protein